MKVVNGRWNVCLKCLIFFRPPRPRPDPDWEVPGEGFDGASGLCAQDISRGHVQVNVYTKAFDVENILSKKDNLRLNICITFFERYNWINWFSLSTFLCFFYRFLCVMPNANLFLFTIFPAEEISCSKEDPGMERLLCHPLVLSLLSGMQGSGPGCAP